MSSLVLLLSCFGLRQLLFHLVDSFSYFLLLFSDKAMKDIDATEPGIPIIDLSQVGKVSNH